jgi:uncharacterized protein YcgI (DUF1989 family)
MADRKLVDRYVLDPTTGKAIPVLRGQVLRIRQMGKGQCLDFNAFNLHDYKEAFHCGRTRHMHGLNPTRGDHLWSAPPRDRPMFTIIEDTVGTNDVNYPRCSAFLFEYQFGFDQYPAHSNCHDILAEAIREWGLTPDDVHDSFNGFMHTGARDGKLYIDRMVAAEGDYIELLAQIDCLAVPICCGADVFATSNYELKQLEISVFDGNDADRGKLITDKYAHQRTVEQFKQPTIKPDRPLHRDPGFEPEWPWLGAVKARHRYTVALDEREARLLDEIKDDPEFFGLSEDEIVRFCFFRWYAANYMQGPKQLKGVD